MQELLLDGKRIALLNNKPLLVEVRETRLLKCFYIERAVGCEADSLRPHWIPLSEMDRIVSKTELLFLDDKKSISKLYDKAQSAFRLSRKRYHWCLLCSGLLVLQDGQLQPSQPQSVYCYSPRRGKDILKRKEMTFESSPKLWRLPLSRDTVTLDALVS